MDLILTLQQIRPEDRHLVGGKSLSLGLMAQKGIRVPATVCVSSRAYEAFLAQGGLRERILLELNRKDFRDMRWEEIWDASLRIRNMFLKTSMPPDLESTLTQAFESTLEAGPFVVRSSAPAEDSAKASFAGLHDSYVNVHGIESVLEHVHRVWASLWSDAALLYRQDLNLDVETSSMAVAVQEIVAGDRSGVMFGVKPDDVTQAVIESVYGLNQGLVDGAVEPDRWILDRATGRVIEHHVVSRDRRMVPATQGVRLESLPADLRDRAPLGEEELADLLDVAFRLEELFGSPQDVEWTYRDNMLYVLQSRPITTPSLQGQNDKRTWYMSLRKSFETLKVMRVNIKEGLIPEMIREAAILGGADLESLSDGHLAQEIVQRSKVHKKWSEIYWAEFIPFAHGTRLFGQVYNDTVRPDDPYEFMDLLVDTGLASVHRNQMLEDMADMLRKDATIVQALRDGRKEGETERFSNLLDDFLQRYGDLALGPSQGRSGREAAIRLLVEMASAPPTTRTKPRPNDKTVLEEIFMSNFKGERLEEATQLLDLARTSYRLRDDDNIYLGNFEKLLRAAQNMGRSRLKGRDLPDIDRLPVEEIVATLRDPNHRPSIVITEEEAKPEKDKDTAIKPRQMIGQPAGPGISKGNARVIHQLSDLLEFKSGEILVCDAVDPKMTFVIPLAAGIVERRGGMLIHGAIIAREYGLPCVTGVPLATQRIQTGDTLTVDGFLGIVIVG